jgi:hypothetical protein
MEEKKELNVNLNGIPGFGDPSPVLTLIFATLCFCFWANTMGFFTEGAVFAIGVLQLGVFVSYTVGGIILLHRGNAFGGNTYMIFATVFGGVAGSAHVVMSLAGEAGIPFCYQICGVAFIVAGAFLLLMVPGLKYSPKTDFIMFLFGGLGVLGYGLTGAGLAPAWLNYPAAWCLLIDGLTGFYTVIVTMLGYLGISLPLGRPFFKPAAEI